MGPETRPERATLTSINMLVCSVLYEVHGIPPPPPHPALNPGRVTSAATRLFPPPDRPTPEFSEWAIRTKHRTGWTPRSLTSWLDAISSTPAGRHGQPSCLCTSLSLSRDETCIYLRHEGATRRSPEQATVLPLPHTNPRRDRQPPKRLVEAGEAPPRTHTRRLSMPAESGTTE